MSLIESYANVKAIFHGHNHRETGRYLSGGKPYFVLTVTWGGNWGSKKGYRVVEIYNEGTIRTYQYNAEDSVVMNTHLMDSLSRTETVLLVK